MPSPAWASTFPGWFLQLLAEDYLARNPVGDQGAPEAGAPPAAGGAL
jgi:hypothetical protein